MNGQQDDRRVHRWHDRLDIVVAMTIAVGSLIGWLHSDWKISSQVEVFVTDIIPMVKADHERIIHIEDRLNRK